MKALANIIGACATTLARAAAACRSVAGQVNMECKQIRDSADLLMTWPEGSMHSKHLRSSANICLGFGLDSMLLDNAANCRAGLESLGYREMMGLQDMQRCHLIREYAHFVDLYKWDWHVNAASAPQR